MDDYAEALKVVRYLHTTRELGITIECKDLQFHVYCDASHQVHSDAAGHTGYLIGFGENCSYLHARSGKQKMYALSSTDAEICAMTESLKMIVWLRELLSELNICEKTQVVLYQDNQAVVKLTSEDGDAKRTKHMLSRLNYCKDLVRRGVVVVRKVATEVMRADVLTKPLHGKSFMEHRAFMMNLEYIEDVKDKSTEADDNSRRQKSKAIRFKKFLKYGRK